MLNNFKEKFTNMSTNGLEIPISSLVIEQLIKTKSDIKDLTVEITADYLIIHGTTEVKKMLIKKNVPFIVKLKPIDFLKRTIQFRLIDMKPVDINALNSKIFNKPPFLEYMDRIIKIDFNVLDVIKKIPVGNIKSYEMVNGAIKINISL